MIHVKKKVMPACAPCSRSILAAVCAVFVMAGVLSGQVVISEFMAGNNLVLSDFEGDDSDWIEIHNQGALAVDLGGKFLTDSPSDFTKWVFPSPTVLVPGDHLLVFASNKDIAVAGQELHTNFKLDTDGEFLALFDTDGVTLLSGYLATYPRQFTDVSYGISYDPQPTPVRGYFVNPTPGSANGIAGAVVGDVDHSPAIPNDVDDLVVTAEVVDPPGINTASVTMYHRVGYQTESTTMMVDDGTGSDLVPNDGIWTAVIPQGASSTGDMIRWRFTTVDAAGGPSAKLPLYPTLLDSPEYFGTRVDDPAVASSLETLYWFISNPFAANNQFGTRSSVFYAGEFYDNVHTRTRGGSSLSWSKKSYKIDFNRGFHFRYLPNEKRVEEINLNSTWSDKSYLRQILSWETYLNAGAVGSLSSPVRVQQNGQFFSVATWVEQPDGEMLERNGLHEDGALYKMYNQCTSATSGVEKKTRLWEGNGDLQVLVSGVLGLNGTALEHFLFDNIDVPAVISYLVATAIIHDNDHVHKNYYLYRESEGDLEWRFIPWDKDLTFGRNYTLSGGVLNDTIWVNHNTYSHPLFGDSNHPKVDGFWNRLIDACYQTPRIRDMMLRRLRTVMDDLLQDPSTSTPNLKFENRIGQLMAVMAADVALDQATWGTPNWGNQSLNFAAGVNQLQNSYLALRRQYLYVNQTTGTGVVPAAQGPAVVRLGDVDHSPVSGNSDEEYLEIRNCSPSSVDLSGWQIQGGVTFTMPPGTALLAGESVYVAGDSLSFRARTTGPSGGQGLFVVGPFEGNIGAQEDVILLNEHGSLVDMLKGGFSHDLATTGVGDASLTVDGGVPLTELYVLLSVQGLNQQVGCGPLFGLGTDALMSILLPLNTQPFHILADSNGHYGFAAAAGSIPSGFTVDCRVLNVDFSAGAIHLTAPSRTVF